MDSRHNIAPSIACSLVSSKRPLTTLVPIHILGSAHALEGNPTRPSGAMAAQPICNRQARGSNPLSGFVLVQAKPERELSALN